MRGEDIYRMDACEGHGDELTDIAAFLLSTSVTPDDLPLHATSNRGRVQPGCLLLGLPGTESRCSQDQSHIRL